MLGVISMIFSKIALFIGSILPLTLPLDDNTSISIRGIILFFFIVALAIEVVVMLSNTEVRRNK